MAMTKAEMEAHRAQYFVLVSDARDAQQNGLYKKAVEAAVSSWDYVVGMMQYERKYEQKESVSVEGIEIVLKLAPFLLDLGSLEKLAALLKSQRRIEKHASGALASGIETAKALLWDAYRLWQHLEAHPDARQDALRATFGGDQDRWRGMAETWEKMELIRRTPEGGSYRLALSTRRDEPTLAKCPGCGVVAKAAKAKLFAEVTCPKCRKVVEFVLLNRQSVQSA